VDNVEIILIVRQYEPDGGYKEWQTKPGLTAFTAIVKKEIKKLLGGLDNGRTKNGSRFN
jgi:hypothetical protein